jgi:hypothetical protein
MNIVQSICNITLPLWAKLVMALEALKNPALLFARLYVAQAFFLSGLTKIQNWETTIALFTDEYHVPFLSPLWALCSAGSVCAKHRCRDFAFRDRASSFAATSVLGIATRGAFDLGCGAMERGLPALKALSILWLWLPRLWP